jgi:L-ribulose-5-phosphate 4-epimerase
MIDHNTCIRELLAGLKSMAKRNDVIRDTHGNLSVMNRCSGMVYIKPSGMPYEDIEAHDVCGICISDGLQETGLPRKPSVDTVHHLEIYRRAPHIRAICHTHSPYATVFAIGTRGIPILCTEQADYFGGPIRCVPYHDLDTWGAHAVPKEGEKALLLGNHGALTFGSTPKEAVNLAIALENVAQKTYLALMLHDRSGFVYKLPADEVRKWHERYNNVYGQK